MYDYTNKAFLKWIKIPCKVSVWERDQVWLIEWAAAEYITESQRESVIGNTGWAYELEEFNKLVDFILSTNGTMSEMAVN